MMVQSVSFKPLTNLFYCKQCGFVSEYQETEPLICPKCGKPAENRLFVRTRDLSGNLVGKRLIFKGIILGESEVKTVPVNVAAECDVCGFKAELNLRSGEYRGSFEKLFFAKKDKVNSILTDALPRGPCKTREGHKWKFEVKEWLDFHEAKVQDLIEFEEAQEREAETRSVTAILLEKADVKVGLFDCEVLIAPDNRLMLLIHRVAPLELTEGEIKAEDLAKIERIFKGRSLNELETLLDRVICPEVRGRSRAKLAAALTALSPRWFNVGGQRNVPGCMRTLFFGDPRTGKGMILRWFWQKGIAGHAVGETAARTGLIYSIDPELKILSWGVLPQNDGRMVCIEGLHGLSSEELERFREVLAQQRVEVHRLVKGAAWCRTRILADLNPNQPSLSDNYPYVCSALMDSKPFYKPIDLTRWDLFVPFRQKDVPPEEMYGEVPKPEKDEETAFVTLVKWGWSRKTAHMTITDEAFQEAKAQFKQILDEYSCEGLPIIHNAGLWSLLRISIAIAALNFNSPDGEHLIVEKKHVQEAAFFWRQTLDDIELAEAKAIFEEKPLTEMEIEEIRKAFSEDKELNEVFNEVINRPGDVSELAGRLGVSNVTVKRKASKLKELGLLQRGKQGYKVTKKGIELFRLLRAEAGPVKNGDTIDTFDTGSREVQKFSGKNLGEAEKRYQRYQKYQFLSRTACEKCGKIGAYTVMREGAIHYLCEKCLADWEGPL